MRVLFVVRSKSKDSEIVPFILSQLESIRKQGLEVGVFPVMGNGILAYIRQSKQLHNYLKNNKFDLIHAHYSLCGWTAVLARTGKPIVLSLMGSDALGEYISSKKISHKSRVVVLLTFLVQPFVNAIISKSKNINNRVYRKSIAHIIPNGIELECFKPGNKLQCRFELGLHKEKKYILFLYNPENKWKNLKLAHEAINILSDNRLELLVPYPVSHNDVGKYFNATDIFINTSYMEGSPNVIKEAMACNCPIVSTDIGDVKWVMGDTQGCFISSFDPEDMANKIKQALSFAEEFGRTKGRQRIIGIGLDSEKIATRVIEIYKRLLSNKN